MLDDIHQLQQAAQGGNEEGENTDEAEASWWSGQQDEECRGMDAYLSAQSSINGQWGSFH